MKFSTSRSGPSRARAPRRPQAPVVRHVAVDGQATRRGRGQLGAASCLLVGEVSCSETKAVALAARCRVNSTNLSSCFASIAGEVLLVAPPSVLRAVFGRLCRRLAPKVQHPVDAWRLQTSCSSLRIPAPCLRLSRLRFAVLAFSQLGNSPEASTESPTRVAKCNLLHSEGSRRITEASATGCPSRRGDSERCGWTRAQARRITRPTSTSTCSRRRCRLQRLRKNRKTIEMMNVQKPAGYAQPNEPCQRAVARRPRQPT